MTVIAPADALERPLSVPTEAYLSADYARAERERLWRKVWLQAGRLEDIPEVGDFITYDILDDSVIIVRTGPDTLRAHANVCGFHGWTYDRAGQCTFVQHRDDWQGSLGDLHLGEVKVDSWGGWIWISLDPAAVPLREWLEPAASLLDPFQLENMRPRWRKWIVFECNWKVALEAFSETYHVQTTHPEFNAFGEFRGWARNHGLHTNIGYEAPKGMDENQAKLRVGAGTDARLSTAEMQDFTWAQANTNTTQTLVEAARRLKDELPEGTPPAAVLQHWLKSARADDAARGVVWPTVDPAHTAKSGTAWQIFPNFQIGHAVNNMLCYSARPYGADPDKCIFEAAVYELYPEGEAPATEWDYTAPGDWPPVLQQDFANMAAVQQGMKNGAFKGTLPNPYMERSIASLHWNLARYMGTGAPQSTDGES